MIEVEVEDEAWVTALPDCAALVEQAVQAVIEPSPPLWGRGQGEGGASAMLADDPADPQTAKVGASTPAPLPPSPQGGGGALSSEPRGENLTGDEVITVLLTDDETVQDLNARFRGKDKPTNVLSFPAAESARPHLGDIALAYGVCAEEAKAQGKPLAHHLMHLTVHGVLHLLGYDHETDAEAEDMEGMERAILSGLGVPDPYAHPDAGIQEANA